MGNGHKWELLTWGDGIPRLAYWNWLSGDDIIIRLTDEGAFEETHPEDENGEIIDVDADPVLKPIPDLAQFLRQALQKIDTEVAAYYDSRENQ